MKFMYSIKFHRCVSAMMLFNIYIYIIKNLKLCLFFHSKPNKVTWMWHILSFSFSLMALFGKLDLGIYTL